MKLTPLSARLMIFIPLFVSFLSFYWNDIVIRTAAKTAEKERHIPFQSSLRTNRCYGHFGGIMSQVIWGKKLQRIAPVGNLFREKGGFELYEGGDSQKESYFWSKWFILLHIKTDWFEWYQGGDEWYGFMFWSVEFAWTDFIFSYRPGSGAIWKW